MDPSASVRRFHALINAGELDQFIDLLAEDSSNTGRSRRRSPPEQFTMPRGVPDMQWEPEDVLVDGDRAVARLRLTATHDGELMGMPATGKPINIQVIDIRFSEDGRAREHWGVLDTMGLMAQIGAVSGPRAVPGPSPLRFSSDGSALERSRFLFTCM